jgi:hypothetical protein
MASSSAAQPQHKNEIDGRTQLVGFLCSNGIFLGMHAIFWSLMLGGIFVYPRTIGLYLTVPYLGFIILSAPERKDGQHWHSFSRTFPLFRILRNYLQLEIQYPLPKELIEEEKKKGAQFIFAVFPHGVNSDYRILMDGILHESFPNIAEKIRTLAATILFRVISLRELSLWTGCVDARRDVANRLLDRGRSLLVLPGGMDEQIRTTHGREQIYLKHRKGFLKLAMRKGVPVVPVYVFGASDLYYTSRAFFGLRLKIMKNLGFCIPLFIGKWGSPLCPLPVKTTIVFGNALKFDMKEIGNPTQSELDAAHELFMRNIRQLFDENKVKLGYGDRELEIL